MVKDPASSLLYGGPGAGKTATALSSFYNWKTGELFGHGKLITFGRENNPALNIPIECRQTPGGSSLHFSSPKLNDFSWVDKFEAACDGLLVAARQGNCLDALVVDGMSEFDLLYESVFQNNEAGGDKFAKWDALLNQMFAAMQRLDPVELNCDVFVTARVMEKKRGSVSRSGSTVAGDPAFLDFDYYPSLRGSFRLHFPHYFNLVLYMETQMKLVTAGELKGKRMPAHVLNMVRTGDFYVKNQWEYPWLRGGLPTQLFNPDWPDVREMLLGVSGEVVPSVREELQEFEHDADIDFVPETPDDSDNMKEGN
jgi:hypothetical protein